MHLTNVQRLLNARFRALTVGSTFLRKMSEAVIVSAVRTPVGCFKGSLSSIQATDLGSIVIKEAMKAAVITPGEVDEVIMGQVLQAGCKQSPARQAAVKAGCPFSVDVTTINKVCASSMKAITLGAQSIMANTNKIVVAGGMESMSNAPFLVSREAPTYGGSKMEDSITHDSLMCAFNGIHMGACTDKLAVRYKITREDQDEYAKKSYMQAAESWKNDLFKNEIVYVPVPNKRTGEVMKITEDEEYKKFMPDKMSKIKPAFTPDGTITPANASKLNDGASAVVLLSADEAKARALKPLAKVLSFADAAVEPADFGIAPAFSIKKALAKAEIDIRDVAMFEINEAFSAVPLACIKELGLDPKKVNIHGGAVAFGHPIGASGARIVTHMVHALEPHQVGVAAICNGGGGSTAIVVRKLANL